MEAGIEILEAIKIGIERENLGSGFYLYAENYNPLGPADMLFQFKTKGTLAEISRVAGPRELLSSVPLTLSKDEDFTVSFAYDGHRYVVEGSVYPYDGAVPVTLTLKVTKFN